MEDFTHTLVIAALAAVVALTLVVAARAMWLQRRVACAHAALAVSEARLADAQRIATMGSWDWNILTNDLVWSDQIYRIFGLEPQQFVPTYPAFLERIHPEDRGSLEEAVGKALKEGVPYDIHHRVVRVDGGVRVVREQGEITLSSDGRPVRMLGTCQDVTERVRLEEESEEQRLLLRNTLDSMFAFIGVFSVDGVLIDVNRALMDAFRLSRDEIIGTALWNTYAWSHSPEAQQQARDALTRAAQGEIVRGDFVVRVDAVTLMTVDVIFGPLRDRDGRIARVIASGVDVTARKQAEERIQASEARLRTILESEPECVKVLGADCRLLDMNTAGLRMIGAASIDQVRGNSVLDLLDPKYRTAYADGVAAVFAGQTTLQKFEFVSLDGTRRWMEQHAAPLFDQGNPGKVREMIAITRDVTERVRMEQAAREVREALEEAQRIANIGSWEWDFATDELSWSEQCYRIVGWEIDGSKPTTERFLESVHPDDRARIMATIRAGLEEGAPCDYDHRVVWPNGEVRAVHQLAEVERNAEGRPIRMIGTTQDVTLLRSVEEELRQSRATLSGILTISPEGVIVADPEGRITLFSAGAEAIFGYEAEDVVGREVECLMPERYRAAHRGHLSAFAAGSGASRRMGGRAEIVGLRKNGEEFPAQASLSKLNAPGGVVFTTILRDVSQEKAIRAELLEAKLKAESANQAKSSFVASMSHELRTPLNAVIGFSELLMSDSDAISEKKRIEYAGDIHTSGKHLLGVINDILDISRIEAGKVTLAEEAVSAAELIDFASRMVRSRAEEIGVAVHVRLSPALPKVKADRRLLLQVVLNLASNAVKFTEKGGSVDLVAQTGASGGVEIIVRDTGIGMSAADMARVGEPFLQVDGRLARRFEGTGLGLAIAKRLVELHGGRLDFESAPGKGTTITIRLPSTRCVAGGSASLVAAAV